MKNGTCWLDTDGKFIQAHGGCILFHKGLYYWYGENKDTPTSDKAGALNRVDFIGFSCYSSPDMRAWKNEGLVLRAINEAEHELNPANVGERPKVLYNKKTGKFALWFHLDRSHYDYARVGIALADTPTGPFVYQGSIKPCGRDSRDMYVFQDEDDSAYLVSSTDWNSTTLICRINDTYTGLRGDAKTAFAEQYREGHVILKEKDRYYHFSSGCTGWAPNSMLYGIADAPMGIWKLIDNPCSGKDYRKTFFGQTANAFKLDNQWYIMLDHWNPKDLRISGYSFLPIHIEGDYAEIPWTEDFLG
jgi:hypothetical protein